MPALTPPRAARILRDAQQNRIDYVEERAFEQSGLSFYALHELHAKLTEKLAIDLDRETVAFETWGRQCGNVNEGDLAIAACAAKAHREMTEVELEACTKVLAERATR